MKRTLASICAVAALAATGLVSGTGAAASPTGDRIPGYYVVVLQDGADAGAVSQDHANRHGANVSHVYRHALQGYAARLSDQAVERIRSDSRVQWVEPDRVVSIAAQSLPTGINRVDGELSTTLAGDGLGSVDVDVAVLDTGIDLDHPDLNVVAGKNCTGGGAADDGNGHGTHVAGTIGAKDDLAGVVGVAPGARLWAVKVLNNGGTGSVSAIVCGIDYVTANASSIEVANMSLGGGGSDDNNCGNSNNDSEHKAICRSVAAGVTYAVAAGNSYVDAKSSVPAAYDEVITVSALADFNGLSGGGAPATCRTDEDDTFANFSNYGADVDLIAPGVCIYSTYKSGGYGTVSGTSQASPHVAGAAALYKASNPGATPAQVKTALQSAGNLDWSQAGAKPDPDGVKEVLVNVGGF